MTTRRIYNPNVKVNPVHPLYGDTRQTTREWTFDPCRAERRSLWRGIFWGFAFVAPFWAAAATILVWVWLS